MDSPASVARTSWPEGVWRPLVRAEFVLTYLNILTLGKKHETDVFHDDHRVAPSVSILNTIRISRDSMGFIAIQFNYLKKKKELLQ